MSEQVIEKLEDFGLEKSAIPDGLHLRSIVLRVISDSGRPVADTCAPSLKTKDTQVAGAGGNATPVFVIMLAALPCLSSVLLDKRCRPITAALRGDGKPIWEREILESCDQVNV